MAQPASVIWVKLRSSTLSFICVWPRKSSLNFASTRVVGDSASAAAGDTRAARPSLPSGLERNFRPSSAGSRRKAGARATRPASPMRLELKSRPTSAGSRRKAGARATISASPMPNSFRVRALSRGRAPRPRAAASAEAPASPTCTWRKLTEVKAGSAPAPSPAISRCTPSGPSPVPQMRSRLSCSSAGRTDPSDPSNVRSAAERPLQGKGHCRAMAAERPLSSSFASRSSLKLRMPILRHSVATAASWSVLSCCRSACVRARSSGLTLLKSTAIHGSSTLHSLLKMVRCWSSLSFESAIAARPRARAVVEL
eukprot:scaffold11855_cov61-Phaeocystis_antarctica.AAC.8